MPQEYLLVTGSASILCGGGGGCGAVQNYLNRQIHFRFEMMNAVASLLQK